MIAGAGLTPTRFAGDEGKHRGTMLRAPIKDLLNFGFVYFA